MSIHNIIMAAAGNIGGELIGSEQNQLTANSGSLTINKPSGTVQGDIMIAVTASDNGNIMNQLTGWTRILSAGASDNKLTIQYKVAGSGEGSSYTFICNDSTKKMSGCIATFRNVTYDKIGSSDTRTGGSSANAPSITPTLNNSILVAAYANEQEGDRWSPPSGMTLIATDNYSQGGANLAPCFAVFYQDEVAASATGIKSCGLDNTGQTTGVLLALSPA